MTTWFRYGPPRWYLVRLCGRLPDGRVQNWLLDFLYPSDLRIEFNE